MLTFVSCLFTLVSCLFTFSKLFVDICQLFVYFFGQLIFSYLFTFLAEIYFILQILKNAQAYEFTCRGKIKVKGKGEMTTYFLTDRKASATMRVDDLLHQQYYANQHVQYSNLPPMHHQLTQAMFGSNQICQPMVMPTPPSPLNRRMPMQGQARAAFLIHEEEAEEPLIPPRSSSKPQALRTVRPQTPPSHPRVLETSTEICHQRLHTPPRALLNMDITQRNQVQTRASLSPPPPAPVSRDSNPPLHPPLAALVSQRREALVRTNPRIGPVSPLIGDFGTKK